MKRIQKKHRITAIIEIVMLFFVSGCIGTVHGQQEKSISFFAMDTYMTVRAWGVSDETLAACRAEAGSLEALLSVTREDSEIARLNRDGRAGLSPATAGLLEKALTLCAQTDGALDISVYPAVKAWGFTTGAHRVPGGDELAALRERVGWRRVALEGAEASLAEGTEIDLGSVAKGYAGDRMLSILREGGAVCALLDLGGNVQTMGTKPDGSPWRIAVRDPRTEGNIGVLETRGGAVVTSGGYQRFFDDEDGNRWWHIMDPATCMPARSGLLSATAVGDEGTVCDALSTALFVMGAQKASAYWREHGGFGMILVTEEGDVLVTEDLADRFSMTEGAGGSLRIIHRDED